MNAKSVFLLCLLSLFPGFAWAGETAWSERMQSLSSILRELLIDSAGTERKRFNDFVPPETFLAAIDGVE